MSVARRARLDRSTVMALAVVAIWATNVVVVKWALREWEPLAYSFDRFAVGTALFALWVWWREGSLRVARRDLPLLALAGAIGIFGNQVTFMYAAEYAPAATVSLLMATAPAFAAVAAHAAGQETVRGRHWLGLAVAAAGTLLVLQASGLDLRSLRGDVLALGMAGTWAGYSVAIRPLMRRYTASRISVVVLLVGVPMLLPFSWGQVTAQDYGGLSAGAWAAVVFSLLFSLVLTNILWFGAVHRGGASRATAVLPLQPFLGAILAMVFLGEDVGLQEWIGGLVIVLGVAITQRRATVEPEPT